jgi:uncharacterized protein YpmB
MISLLTSRIGIYGIIALAVIAVFGSLFAAYKIKAHQLDVARSALASANTTIAVQNTTIAAHNQNTQAIKTSTKKQQDRETVVAPIREQIAKVSADDLLDEVERDLCALITKLYNRGMLPSTDSDPATKGLLPPTHKDPVI